MRLLFHIALCAYSVQVARANLCGKYPGEDFNRGFIVGNWTAVSTTESNKRCHFLVIDRYWPFNNEGADSRGMTTRFLLSYLCKSTEHCCETLLAGNREEPFPVEERHELYDCDGATGIFAILLQFFACISCEDIKACYWGGQVTNITVGPKGTPCAGHLEVPVLDNLENVKIRETDYCNYIIIEYSFTTGKKVGAYVRDLGNDTAVNHARERATILYSEKSFYNSNEGICTYCYYSVPIP